MEEQMQTELLTFFYKANHHAIETHSSNACPNKQFLLFLKRRGATANKGRKEKMVNIIPMGCPQDSL